MTTGAAILFMGALALTLAALSGALGADVFGFIDRPAVLSIALTYLAVGGLMVFRGRAAED